MNQLAKLQNVTVISRTSVMQYAGSEKTVPEIADELNVETVMAGRVRYAGDEVRVSTELIDGATDTPVWTEAYDGDLSDIFGIQADIAMNVANALQASFSVAEQESIERLPTDSPEAYALFLQARELWLNATAGDLELHSVVGNILDQALELDPEFALAHAERAWTYEISKRFDLITESEWPAFKVEMERLTLAHADTAIALDPNIAAARTVRAFVHLDNSRAELAQLEAEEALRLLPNDTEVLSLNGLLNREYLGRPEVAVGYLQRATSLDPYESQWRTELGQALTSAGRYGEAIEAFEKCSELVPTRTNCRYSSSVPKFLLGDNQAALASLRLAEQLAGDDSANSLVWVTHGYGLLEEPDDAQRTFNTLEALSSVQYVDPPQWAWAHMGIGDYDEALRLTNIAIENPERIRRPGIVSDIRLNTWSDPVLEEPQWVEVRNRLRSMQ